LNKLLGHVTIAQGGVLPNIHQSTSASALLQFTATNGFQTCFPRRLPRLARAPRRSSKCLFFFLRRGGYGCLNFSAMNNGVRSGFLGLRFTAQSFAIPELYITPKMGDIMSLN
jgi:hypothetical protein